jgi:hypothetical protein
LLSEKVSAMKKKCCRSSNLGSAAADRTRTSAIRQALNWIVSSAILAAMPKCPLCVAAYVALFTGFGISLAVAKFAWWFVGVSCLLTLVYVATTTAISFIKSL